MASKKIEKEPPIARRIAAEIAIVTDPPDSPPINILEVLREAYAMAVAAHDEIYRILIMANERVERAQVPLEEMVDCAFAARETNALVDDLRKQLTAFEESLAQAVSIQWVTMDEPESKIEGQYCNGFPSVKLYCKLPTLDKSPEKYNLLMDYLGVAQDVRDQGKLLTQEGEFKTEVLKLDFNGFADWITRAQLGGYALPPGIDEKDIWRKPALKVVRKFNLLPPMQPKEKQ